MSFLLLSIVHTVIVAVLVEDIQKLFAVIDLVLNFAGGEVSKEA